MQKNPKLLCELHLGKDERTRTTRVSTTKTTSIAPKSRRGCDRFPKPKQSNHEQKSGRDQGQFYWEGVPPGTIQ